MERQQWQQIAVGAGVVATLVAIATGRLPRAVRITLVLGLVALACGAGLFAYRYVTTPTTLTVAAGSLDGDVPRSCRRSRPAWRLRHRPCGSRFSTR